MHQVFLNNLKNLTLYRNLVQPTATKVFNRWHLQMPCDTISLEVVTNYFNNLIFFCCISTLLKSSFGVLVGRMKITQITKKKYTPVFLSQFVFQLPLTHSYSYYCFLFHPCFFFLLPVSFYILRPLFCKLYASQKILLSKKKISPKI